MRTHQPAARVAIASRAEPKGAERSAARPRPVQPNRIVAAAQPAQEPVHQFATLAPQRATEAVRPPNRTGLPDRLKAGIEHLSGFAMDDVRVHYNSTQPAAVQALAYTKGNEIHVGPGQEQHLPHEAWHVVQQKQGRVKPTLQMKGVAINDDRALEQEADRIGSRAASQDPRWNGANVPPSPLPSRHRSISGVAVLAVTQCALQKDKLNVVGENHEESNDRRDEERKIQEQYAPGGYWREEEFEGGSLSWLAWLSANKTEYADDPLLRAKYAAAKILQIFELNSIKKALQDHGKNNNNNFVDALPQTGVYYAEIRKNYERALKRDKTGTNLTLWQNCQKMMEYAVELQNGNHDDKTKSNFLSSLNTIRSTLGNRSLGQISKERSDHMHEVASTKIALAKKGVWKIGDSHATDLSRDKKPKQYALMSKHDFNKEYFPEQAEVKVPDMSADIEPMISTGVSSPKIGQVD